LLPYRSGWLAFAEGPKAPAAKEERVVEDDVKVLLIEDDVAAAEMYRLRLAADGYLVIIGHDGTEGLRLATDEAPDFIYLDLRMPGLDGFEVLERLRAEPATMHIPVIILTNFGEPELRERGMRLGALEFLVKADTTPAHLSESVERAVGPRALPST
jgi:DNA-binding response OmpR family regulator